MVQIALGDDSMLLLDHAGGVQCWLGGASAAQPVRGLGGVQVVSIGCGAEHCMVCTSAGAALSWGSNDEGQLGLGDRDDRDEPCALELPADEKGRAVSCIASSSFLLTQGGHALSCGLNDRRQLGHPDPALHEAPPRRRQLPEPSASGGEDGGEAGGGGEATEEEDGSDDELVDEASSDTLRYLALPGHVAGLLVQISCASEHGAALTSDGRVVTWGNAEGGRLGRGRTRGASVASHAQPSVVTLLADQQIQTVSTGGAHTVAVTESGRLWMWGQISNEATYRKPARALGEMLGGAYFVRAAALGDCFTVAVAIPPDAENEDEDLS